MRLPLNDLKQAYLSAAEEIDTVVSAAISSGWWLNGEQTRNFCSLFAAYLKTSHCIGVGNGTDALEIAMRALLALRGGSRNEVVTVANAGGYSTIAIRQIGLTPVYADIEESSQLGSISSMIEAMGPDTALVVVTHLYGGVLDVFSLRQRMDAAGYAHVPILEDCAQAHGAVLSGHKVGTIGDIGAFSFYPTKNLGAFGDAGAIVSSNDELAKTCDSLRQYGWAQKYDVAQSGGRNSRMDEVQAAILSIQLKRLDKANERRVSIIDRYAAVCPEGAAIVRSPLGNVGHLAVLLTDHREALRAHFAECEIATDIHYPILDCDQTGWKGLPQKLAPGGLTVARRSVSRLLTVPCFPGMTDNEVNAVCDALTSFSL